MSLRALYGDEDLNISDSTNDFLDDFLAWMSLKGDESLICWLNLRNDNDFSSTFLRYPDLSVVFCSFFLGIFSARKLSSCDLKREHSFSFSSSKFLNFVHSDSSFLMFFCFVSLSSVSFSNLVSYVFFAISRSL